MTLVAGEALAVGNYNQNLTNFLFQMQLIKIQNTVPLIDYYDLRYEFDK